MLALLPVERAQTLDGAVMSTAGAAAMATVREPLAVQEADVIETFRTTFPDAPALNVTALVPWPAVMLPPVIDQA